MKNEDIIEALLDQHQITVPEEQDKIADAKTTEKKKINQLFARLEVVKALGHHDMLKDLMDEAKQLQQFR